jgi:hypothetical protein
VFRWTCGDDTRVLYYTLRTRLRVQRAPGIPHALSGRKVFQSSGASRRGAFRRLCIYRHCEERLVRRSSTSEGGSDEAIQLSFLPPYGLLRFARNDDWGGGLLRGAKDFTFVRIYAANSC